MYRPTYLPSDLLASWTIVR